MLSVSLLGDLSIRYDGAPVTDVDSPRLQSLLAYLILHGDAPQSRAHLSFLFWPDTSEAQARTNLRNLLHSLRRALPNADSYLEAGTQTLQWKLGGPCTLDTAAFSAALVRAEQAQRAGDRPATRDALEQAVSLYGGDLLPSCYDDWILPERERLRQAYLGALERLIQLQEGQRDYPAALESARRLLLHDPLHEVAYRHLMRLHALSGDRAGALRAYHTCATVLQRELEVEPSVATREAYEQLLGAEARAYRAGPATAALPPLVGREREWTQMQQAWRAVAAGGGPLALFLRGEAGIGKTRLAEELLQWAVRQGIAGASARCYAAEGRLAYAPVAAWLRSHPLSRLEDARLAEVARLMPELLVDRPNLPRPLALTEGWQRERLFEALTRAVLGAGRPLLLTIDDLQWCDRDTLEWLHYLVRFDHQARLLVAGTYRPEEVGEGDPLLSTLAALRHDGRVIEIDLGPLGEAATQALAARVAGREVGAATARLLYQETEGNPLFVIETVRAGLLLREPEPLAGASARLPRDPLPGDEGLPPKVRSVLEARLAQLSPPARELAGLAATIGREFSFRLLARASGRDEDTLVRELDELWQRRIVRERGAAGYDFSHGKLREVAYRGLSAARRRLLHRHVAGALEALHAADPDPVGGQVAAHYERAGLPEQAVPYYLRAAQVARRVYASEEAVALLRRGLALVEDAAPGAAESSRAAAARLWEELGDVLALTGRRDEARQAYTQAMAGIPGGDLVWRARLQRRIGTAWDEENRWQEAMQAYAGAETVLGPKPSGSALEWWREWLGIQHRKVWLYYGLGRLDEMSTLAERSRPAVEQYATPVQRGEFFQGLVLLGIRKERYAPSGETLAHAREALEAFREAGDANAVTLATIGLGFTLLWAGRLDEAEQQMLAGLEQAGRSGDVAVQSRALTYLTVLYRMRSQIEQAKQFAARSLALATERGMIEYAGMAKAGLAWLAWREGNQSAAEANGQAAVELWQQAPLSTPFQWTARWPLLAVALAQNRLPDAIGHAQAMLQPEQQRLPPALTLQLEQAAAAWKQADGAAANACLGRALDLARELGYL